MIPMAPPGLGGRPRNSWNSSRKRKLVRLYTLTDLSNAEIQKVLESQGFSPKVRDIQKKLRSLFSTDYTKEYRSYRPRNHDNSLNRATIFSMNQGFRVSKAKRYFHLCYKSEPASSGTKFTICPPSTQHDTPFRDYSDHKSSIYLQPLLDAEPTNSYQLMLDGSSLVSKTKIYQSQPTRPESVVLMGKKYQNPSSEETNLHVQGKVKLATQNCLPLTKPDRSSQADAIACLTGYIDPRKLDSIQIASVCTIPYPVSKVSSLSHNFMRPFGLTENTLIPTCLEAPQPPSGSQVGVANKDEVPVPKLTSPTSRKETSDIPLVASLENENMLHSTSLTKRSSSQEESANGDKTQLIDTDTSTMQRSSPSLLSVATTSRQGLQNTDHRSKYRSAIDHETIASKLPHRSPSYIQHVTSVLRISSSNSCRSSLSTTSWRSSWMSICSVFSRKSDTPSADGISSPIPIDENVGNTFTTRRAHQSEREIWEELINESELIPAPDRRATNGEISLNNRPCCLLPNFISKSCSTCGFSAVHAWARGCEWNTYPFGGPPGPINSRDHFGNTALHFAAASGNANPDFLLKIIESGGDLLAKNSSNQIFLHVLKVTEPTRLPIIVVDKIPVKDFEGYQPLLTRLQVAGYNFLDRDYHGRTVGHTVTNDFLSKMLHLKLVDTKILGLLDNHGYAPIESLLNKSTFSNKEPSHKVSSILAQLDRRRTLISKHIFIHIPDINIIDIHGNTQLITLTKKYNDDGTEEALNDNIKSLISLGAIVDIRDRRGYTALAISVIRGSRPCCQTLLCAGASPHCRTYSGKGILFHALKRMSAAKREGRDDIWARVLSCVNLLVDNGAKLEPNEQDEWRFRPTALHNAA
ncbi:hypothetical protein BGZ60DRAFT_563677 [Tricladium varicosporioides]|nr:hypothetical protein BGZ60DRAFT_563677 [Hymenoscyphus varicosporioides]